MVGEEKLPGQPARIARGRLTSCLSGTARATLQQNGEKQGTQAAGRGGHGRIYLRDRSEVDIADGDVLKLMRSGGVGKVEEHIRDDSGAKADGGISVRRMIRGGSVSGQLLTKAGAG